MATAAQAEAGTLLPLAAGPPTSGTPANGVSGQILAAVQPRGSFRTMNSFGSQPTSPHAGGATVDITDALREAQPMIGRSSPHRRKSPTKHSLHGIHSRSPRSPAKSKSSREGMLEDQIKLLQQQLEAQRQMQQQQWAMQQQLGNVLMAQMAGAPGQPAPLQPAASAQPVAQSIPAPALHLAAAQQMVPSPPAGVPGNQFRRSPVALSPAGTALSPVRRSQQESLAAAEASKNELLAAQRQPSQPKLLNHTPLGVPPSLQEQGSLRAPVQAEQAAVAAAPSAAHEVDVELNLPRYITKLNAAADAMSKVRPLLAATMRIQAEHKVFSGPANEAINEAAASVGEVGCMQKLLDAVAPLPHPAAEAQATALLVLVRRCEIAIRGADSALQLAVQAKEKVDSTRGASEAAPPAATAAPSSSGEPEPSATEPSAIPLSASSAALNTEESVAGSAGDRINNDVRSLTLRLFVGQRVCSLMKRFGRTFKIPRGAASRRVKQASEAVEKANMQRELLEEEMEAALADTAITNFMLTAHDAVALLLDAERELVVATRELVSPSKKPLHPRRSGRSRSREERKEASSSFRRAVSKARLEDKVAEAMKVKKVKKKHSRSKKKHQHARTPTGTDEDMKRRPSRSTESTELMSAHGKSDVAKQANKARKQLKAVMTAVRSMFATETGREVVGRRHRHKHRKRSHGREGRNSSLKSRRSGHHDNEVGEYYKTEKLGPGMSKFWNKKPRPPTPKGNRKRHVIRK